MATRPTPAPFKATVRNDRIKMEIQGSIRVGITQSFYLVDDANERNKIIDELQQIQAKLPPPA